MSALGCMLVCVCVLVIVRVFMCACVLRACGYVREFVCSCSVCVRACACVHASLRDNVFKRLDGFLSLRTEP